MNLKSAILSVLLLAIITIPALAGDATTAATAQGIDLQQIALEAEKSFPSSTASASEALEGDGVKLPPEQADFDPLQGNIIFLNDPPRRLPGPMCEDVLDIPCDSNNPCPSFCYPGPTCPANPCECAAGVCSCFGDLPW